MSLPAPPVPSGLDLRAFHYMGVDVVRFRDSEFALKATGEEFRAGFLLQLASWHQRPASSLPNDDTRLAALAGFGRDVEAWLRVRPGALAGFVECSDGRLYHLEVAEKALESELLRDRNRDRTKQATAARRKQRDEDRDDQRNDNRDDDQRKEMKLKKTTDQKDGRVAIASILPPSVASKTLSRINSASRERNELSVLGVPLPDDWAPDAVLCDKLKADFGMTEEDLRKEIPAFHAVNVSGGMHSQSWPHMFYLFCKRWYEHKAKQAQSSIQLSRPATQQTKRPEELTELDWDGIVRLYARTGVWSRHAGPDPMQGAACKAPRHILERHAIDLETGERRFPPRAAGK